MCTHHHHQLACFVTIAKHTCLLTLSTAIWRELAAATLEGSIRAVAYTATVLDIAVIPHTSLLLRYLGNCVSPLLCCQYFALAVTAYREHTVYDLASVAQGPVLDQGDWLFADGTMNWALLGEQAVPVLEEKCFEHGLQL